MNKRSGPVSYHLRDYKEMNAQNLGVMETIKNFIKANFLFSEDTGELEDTTSFLDSGIVDSTGMLEIVEFLEETFGIKVRDEELIPENLDSIENLTNFVSRKLKTREEEEVVRPANPG